MKKILSTAFVFGLFMPFFADSASAYDEFRDSGVIKIPAPEQKTHWRIKRDNRKKLLKSIENRRKFYQKKYFIRNRDYKNRKNTLRRHKINRFQNEIPERSTRPIRSGELRDVPFYRFRQERNRIRTSCPNTQKNNFRARAIDYYVEGGSASTDVICAGATRADMPKEKKPYWQRLFTKNRDEIAKVQSKIRQSQYKSVGRFSRVPTGYQKTTIRTGDVYRNFFHPWQKKD